MAREYEPAKLIHRLQCRDLSETFTVGDRKVRPIPEIVKEFPNARPHNCLDPHTQVTVAVILEADWPDHEYKPSSITFFEPWPDGTCAEPPVTALCEFCRGTCGVHLKQGPRERIEVKS